MASTTTAPITKSDLARDRMFGIHLPEPPAEAARPAGGRCGLTLRINGTPYRVRKLDPEFARHRAFRLTKPDGSFYDVSDGVYGAECSCGSFIWRHDGIDNKGCKHIRAARACGLID